MYFSLKIYQQNRNFQVGNTGFGGSDSGKTGCGNWLFWYKVLGLRPLRNTSKGQYTKLI